MTYQTLIRRCVETLATMAVATLIGGCHDDKNIDADLRALIAEKGLTGDPAADRIVPSIDEPLPQLGKKLFFTKALGGDMDTACVTCHHPALGGGDALPLSIGVAAERPDLLGPGRRHAAEAPHHDGGPTVPRNAPTTFNIALWDQVIFHDGRVESLGKTRGANGADGFGIRTPDAQHGQPDAGAFLDLPHAQARFPVTSPEEMRGFSFMTGVDNAGLRVRLAERLGDYGPGEGELARNFWLEEFQAAFESNAPAERLVTFSNIARALAAYEASQLFVDSPWSRFVAGDNTALPEEAKRGALTFFRAPEAGGAGCVSCHSGDAFTDEQFHVVAIPQFGRGKGDGPTGDNDFGRFRETGVDGDRFAFRTPSLLNVQVTGPYGHTGAYSTLEEVVRHHLDAENEALRFEFAGLPAGTQIANAAANTSAAADALRRLRAAGQSKLPNVLLTDAEIAELVAFLESLTDPCVLDRACLAPWIAGAPDADPDGLRVEAVGADGQRL